MKNPQLNEGPVVIDPQEKIKAQVRSAVAVLLSSLTLACNPPETGTVRVTLGDSDASLRVVDTGTTADASFEARD